MNENLLNAVDENDKPLDVTTLGEDELFEILATANSSIADTLQDLKAFKEDYKKTLKLFQKTLSSIMSDRQKVLMQFEVLESKDLVKN